MFTWCQGCIIQHMSAQAILFQTDAKTSSCPPLQFCVCVCLYVWFLYDCQMVWFRYKTYFGQYLSICHAHPRTLISSHFFRPKRFEDLWGILNRCCMLPQHHWIILRLPSSFCGTANHCTLLHQSKNSLPSHPSLIFPRPVQNCLFQHKSAQIQAVTLAFSKFTGVGTVCIRLLEINPRVSDPHSITGLF